MSFQTEVPLGTTSLALLKMRNPSSGRDEAADLCMTRDVVETSMIELATVAKEADKDEEASKHYVEPKTFNQAWNHSDPVQRAKWHK